MPGYSCVICGCAFRSVSASRFPDYYCSRCYSEWSLHEGEAWLKDLIRQEVRNRVRKYRLKKHGIIVQEISLDDVRSL